MRRTNAAAGVAMEVFVKQHVVFEVRVAGQFRVVFEYRALAVFGFEK